MLKRARNLRDIRAAKKGKAEDALCDILDTVLDFLDVEAEGGEDWAPPRLRPFATGYWKIFN